MAPPKQLKELLFIDVETTGLDPTKHELIEIAAIRTSPDGKTTLVEFQAKLKPKHLDRADPKALEVNKYKEEEWTDEICADPSSVVGMLQILSKDTMLVGHNVSFDESFLRPFLAEYKTQPLWDYHKIDTVSLAWPLYVRDQVKSLSLAKLCKELDCLHISTHRAINDARACRELYCLLMSK